jgi:cytochrome c oxidase subunit II
MPFLWVALFLAAGSATADRHFEVTASRFKYEPEVLEVTEGDRVVVTIRSEDVEHGFAIKKLKLKADVPKGGDTARLEFVADKAGTYEITCSEYCGKGHARMKARLVVAPRTVGEARR